MIEDSLGLLLAIIVAGGALFFAVATAILAKLSGDEISGWLPVWSMRFLESAVSRVPADHRERYREEWKAELAAFRDRRLAGLRFAWRLRRRARSVNEALSETEGVGDVFQAEPPVVRKPLEAEVVAEIIRRVVERTRPKDDDWEEILEEMKAALEDLDASEMVAAITERYLGDVTRREARKKKLWKKLVRPADSELDDGTPRAASWGVEDWGVPLSRERAQTPLEIERDAQWRQKVAETRRNLARRRRFWRNRS